MDNFSEPSEDRFHRRNLACFVQSSLGTITCEVSYAALAVLSKLSAESYAEALLAFKKCEKTVKQLWKAKIDREAPIGDAVIALNHTDLREELLGRDNEGR